MSRSKKPYYGKKTKTRLIEDYFKEAITLTELSELHGLLGSNTAAEWLRKYGHLYKPKVQPTMNTNRDTKLSKADKKKKRKKRQRSYEQNQISDLEQLLDMTKTRLNFYRCALEVINELALELTQIDLLKKNWKRVVYQASKEKIMSITKACKELGYSKQAYFKSVKLQTYKEQQEQKASIMILREVKKYRKKMPRIGALKLYFLIAPLLQEKGFKIGRDKFASILKEHNYLVIRKKSTIEQQIAEIGKTNMII